MFGRHAARWEAVPEPAHQELEEEEAPNVGKRSRVPHHEACLRLGAVGLNLGENQCRSALARHHELGARSLLLGGVSDGESRRELHANVFESFNEFVHLERHGWVGRVHHRGAFHAHLEG